jgi:threonine dehydrogenase-like Zn-dependent dehydrogenase
MKALQVTQPHSFSIVQVPKPQLEASASNQIMVRAGWFSMCGSDIPYFTGGKRFKTHPRFKNYPLPWGMPIHECVGQVVESTSERFQPDDWVVAIPENDQGLAEFYIAQDSKAVRLPDSQENKAECCLIQPLSTVMNAVDRLGDVEGKSVAVVGLGSIGLFFCWLLKKRGAGQIIGIDPIVSRCRVAEKFGADQTFAMRSIEVVHLARQNSNQWDPPEICVEAVGHQMDTLDDCIELVKKLGTVLAFGVPDQPVYAIEFETFFRKNVHLMAVVTPVWQEYLQKSRDLFLKFQGELSPLVTHRFTIREAEKAFQLYEGHEDGILKAILDATQW